MSAKVTDKDNAVKQRVAEIAKILRLKDNNSQRYAILTTCVSGSMDFDGIYYASVRSLLNDMNSTEDENVSEEDKSIQETQLQENLRKFAEFIYAKRKLQECPLLVVYGKAEFDEVPDEDALRDSELSGESRNYEQRDGKWFLFVDSNSPCFKDLRSIPIVFRKKTNRERTGSYLAYQEAYFLAYTILNEDLAQFYEKNKRHIQAFCKSSLYYSIHNGENYGWRLENLPESLQKEPQEILSFLMSTNYGLLPEPT